MKKAKFARSFDLAVEVKISLAPPENLLDKREAYELVMEKKREDLTGEKLAE